VPKRSKRWFGGAGPCEAVEPRGSRASEDEPSGLTVQMRNDRGSPGSAGLSLARAAAPE